MATVNDIGVPGQPLNSPPLTEWQAAVRDAINKATAADVWTAWTPTLTGGTASAIDARYHRTPGGLMTINLTLTLATVTGAFSFTIPTNALKASIGIAWIANANGGNCVGVVRAQTNFNGVNVHAISTPSGGFATIANLSASVPFVFEPGDRIETTMQIQVAPLP